MILVSSAVGSNTLHESPPLAALGAQLCPLDSADVAFTGNGVDGPTTVGVEVKSISDVLASLLNGRLNGVDGQLAAMVATYDVRWLCYYGVTRPNPATGVLQVARTWSQKGNSASRDRDRITVEWSDYGGDGAAGKTARRKALTYDYLEKFFVSPAFTALDVRVKQCWDIDEVATWVAALYATWQKPYSEHRCLHTFDQSRRDVISKPPTIKPVTKRELQVATTAFSFPSVGYERAWALAAKYGQPCSVCGDRCKCGRTGVRAMVNAGPAALSEVKVSDGKGRERRIGKIVAQTVEEAIT